MPIVPTVPTYLEVNVLLHVDLQVGRREVVLDRRVSLYNVPPSAPNIHIVDHCIRADVCGPLCDVEHVRAVLEGPSSLVGVDGQ